MLHRRQVTATNNGSSCFVFKTYIGCRSGQEHLAYTSALDIHPWDLDLCGIVCMLVASKVGAYTLAWHALCRLLCACATTGTRQEVWKGKRQGQSWCHSRTVGREPFCYLAHAALLNRPKCGTAVADQFPNVTFIHIILGEVHRDDSTSGSTRREAERKAA